MTTRLGSLLVVVAAPFLFACAAGQADGGSGEAAEGAALSVPGTVKVDGKVVNVESTYLPRVVMCEDGGAPLEALKAQAIAARTYLAFRTAGEASPSIHDGQSDQVYTCALNKEGAYVSQDVLTAVADTKGMVMTWNGKITAGFFVAGDSRVASTCRREGSAASTEHYVTYNFGKYGSSVAGSTIGDTSQSLDRGAMGQRLANCLADAGNYDYDSILRYFYGSDIVVGGASSPAMSTADAASQAASDLPDATCFSDAWDRSVAQHACIQSGNSGGWYQCYNDGTLNAIPSDSNGQPIGTVPCTAVEAQ